jgi:hypothetical protein
MTPEEQSAAKSLWKFFYAKRCFNHVENTCAFILQNGIDEDHPAYYTLVAGIYALYGRPFGDTNIVGMISEKLVPAEFRPLHKIMLKLRNEVYAHTEPSWRSELRVRVSYQGASRVGQMFGREFFSRLPTLAAIIQLCQALLATMERELTELRNRHFPKHLPKEEGEYPINISDPAGPFFFPKQPPADFHS